MIEEDIPDIEFDLEGGSRQVLIDYDPATRKFWVPEAALNVASGHQEIGQYEEGVCLVSFIGEPNCGKSFLLNKVMRLDAVVHG